ncbi:MAG: AAA family ATPase [Anaerolineales bacterium]|nr:AAA family ATPase [Anaerolineales bacterium]
MNTLTAAQLFRPLNPADLPFATTAELNDGNAIIGQQRAVAAIQFGIGIQHDGFNLYVQGPNGIGKFTAVNQYLQQIGPSTSTPADWCYVFNFAQPHQPRALEFPAGQAASFRTAMNGLVDTLFSLIPAALNSDDYQAQKKAIESEGIEKQQQAITSLTNRALEHKISLIRTPLGFAFAPLKDGEVIDPEEYRKLPEAQRQEIENHIAELQDELGRIMRQIPQWQRETQERIKKLDREVVSTTIAPQFHELQARYQAQPAVLAYLEAVEQDVTERLNEFAKDGDEPSLAKIVGESSTDGSKQKRPSRYEVNVIVDHSGTDGAPIIVAEQPRYANLIGRIEHMQQMGALLTDFTLIKPGLLHKANGGYLVIDARKLLQQPYAWEGLKQALRTKEICIESLGQAYSLVSTVSLEPEPIPLQVKVILLGERMLYHLLCYYDPDFNELFKVTADFEDDMRRDDTNTSTFAGLIAALARKDGLRPFDRTAVARVIERAARLAGDADKLTTHMQSIADLLREADFWAGENGHDLVVAADVQQALNAQIQRASRMRERMQEAMLEETILIDTDGSRVGQINGLSVYQLGNFAFGRPSRITARVRLGKGEIIDIERQVELGGPLHSKGVMILAGFLGARYAGDRPFSLSASLVFEQSYGGVDGDSASSAELYTLISALADLPIKQSLAVTGSVNQHGQVQAIGGVNEKIEGFFDLCQARGLTGEQGVLIPAANVRHLMLREDVVAAVEAGQFTIYAVDTIDEGIEILTGLPAGQRDKEGSYPVDSVNGRVVARLAALAEKQRAFAAPASSNGHSAGVSHETQSS